MKRHVQAKHTSEKPFKCNECDYSSTTASNLKTHVQAKHAFEKPFKCNECDYSATTASNLKTHVQEKHASWNNLFYWEFRKGKLLNNWNKWKL